MDMPNFLIYMLKTMRGQKLRLQTTKYSMSYIIMHYSLCIDLFENLSLPLQAVHQNVFFPYLHGQRIYIIPSMYLYKASGKLFVWLTN